MHTPLTFSTLPSPLLGAGKKKNKRVTELWPDVTKKLIQDTLVDTGL